MSTRRGWTIVVVGLLVAVCAGFVVLGMLPDGYDCSSFSIRGGNVTALDSHRVSCSGATQVVQALYRGEGVASRGSGAVVVHRRWHCVSASGLTSCTRGQRWIRAHYTLEDASR